MPNNKAWFLNDGGPLIVIPKEALAFWEGADEPAGGRVVEISTPSIMGGVATDYDRACNANWPAELLTIGPSWGLAISAETTASASWLDVLEPDTRIVVCIMFANEDSDRWLHEVYSHVPKTDWLLNAEAAPVLSTELILMHAVSASEANLLHKDVERAVIGDAILESTPGTSVRIDSSVVDLPDEALLSFHRFRKA